jgi:MoaA/NifB/PqqE/SkfB family radical SAM enzyme
MCIRNYHGGIKNPLLKLNDWSLEDFKNVATKEVLQQINGYYMCGNFGDPIINPNLLEMISYSTETNPYLYVRIHTNGSARNIEWWKNLAEALPKNHKVIFAIDGLEDTHAMYRIGTNYNKILQNAEAFISAGGIAEWCFIKFKHNEHQVEEAKNIAKDIGFSIFTEKNTSRFVGEPKFGVYDENENTQYYLEQPSNSGVSHISYDIVKNYRKILENETISCMAKKNKEIFIDFQKRVFPCCFLASAPYIYAKNDDVINEFRKDVLRQYYDLKNTLGNTNASERPINQIIESEPWQTAWNKYWGDDKLLVCARQCGINKELPKPKDQFMQTASFK